ncbi:hypothetical protein BJ508DRAFT_326482 [Ascobolus immersus RN42]|uniref:Uncharacterized protein n=1 Tax=Ascobolus immersus RN42 TaxID=1160509 RepID=A0A3N4I7A9_ASCIM|nr:hypothetical protein BJ508DRAFT_326482 [Ascobolus immersus RN42]
MAVSIGRSPVVVWSRLSNNSSELLSSIKASPGPLKSSSSATAASSEHSQTIYNQSYQQLSILLLLFEMKNLTILFLSAFAAIGLAVPNTNPNPVFEAAHWAEMNRFNLPRSLSELSSHSHHRRKAAMRLLDDTAKNSLWREHLSMYASTHDLTPEQAGLIQKASTWLENKDPTEKKELYKAAIFYFGKEEAKAAFQTLGEPDSEAAIRKRAPDCDCSTSEDFCPGDDQCRGQGCGKCQIIKDDCGWFDTDDCNGRCFNPEVSC